MFGMGESSKHYFLMGTQCYELVEMEGPIRRGRRACAVQFDHERRMLAVSAGMEPMQRTLVVASAVSEACFRLWRPVPVMWPRWEGEGPDPF